MGDVCRPSPSPGGWFWVSLACIKGKAGKKSSGKMQDKDPFKQAVVKARSWGLAGDVFT